MEFEVAADAAFVANPTQPRTTTVAVFIAPKLGVTTHEKNVSILVKLMGDCRIYKRTCNIQAEVIAMDARIGKSIAPKLTPFAGEACRNVGFGCFWGEEKGMFVNTVFDFCWKTGTTAMEKEVWTLRAAEKWR